MLGVACSLTITCGGAPVGPGVSAVFGRSGAIVRGRTAARASYLGLVLFQRIADRGADVPLGSGPVAGFGRAIPSFGVVIGLVGVGAVSHRTKPNGPRPTLRARFAACAADWPGTILDVPFRSWTLPASAKNVTFIRQSVVDFACENSVDEPLLSDVRLAVTEAVTNAVMHAFRESDEPGTVVVEVTVCEHEWIEICVTDDGAGMAPRDDSPGLGLGLPLIGHLADQFQHRRPADGAGTEIWMRFAFTGGDGR